MRCQLGEDVGDVQRSAGGDALLDEVIVTLGPFLTEELAAQHHINGSKLLLRTLRRRLSPIRDFRSPSS